MKPTADSIKQAKLKRLKLLEEKARRAAREHLLPFTLYTFPGFEVNWHHKLLADKLTDFANGKIKRLIIEAPPGHTKTELASRRCPAFILGKNPDAKIIAASYGSDLSTEISRDVKRIILDDRYQDLFPNTQLNPKHAVTDERQASQNTADRWEIVGRKGSYLARGVGGGITGKRGNFLILDDPVKDDIEARSEAHQEKLWCWYNKVFRSRQAMKIKGADGAGILVIMTRWHVNDLVGRLLDEAQRNPKADQWEVVKLRAMRREEDLSYDPRLPGEMLWPSAFSEKEYWAVTDDQTRAALYDQSPTIDGGHIIKTHWANNFYTTLPDLPGLWLQSWDCKAGSKEPRSSYVAGHVWFRPNGKSDIYLVDRMHGRWDINETMTRIRAMTTKWPKATLKLVEDKADGRGIITMLCREIPGLVAVKPEGDKITRCKAVTPLWEAGNVWLPDRSIAPWIDEPIAEWTAFPGAPHDDDVDAMSQALARFMEQKNTGPVQYQSVQKARWATEGLGGRW